MSPSHQDHHAHQLATFTPPPDVLPDSFLLVSRKSCLIECFILMCSRRRFLSWCLCWHCYIINNNIFFSSNFLNGTQSLIWGEVWGRYVSKYVLVGFPSNTPLLKLKFAALSLTMKSPTSALWRFWKGSLCPSFSPILSYCPHHHGAGWAFCLPGESG